MIRFAITAPQMATQITMDKVTKQKNTTKGTMVQVSAEKTTRRTTAIGEREGDDEKTRNVDLSLAREVRPFEPGSLLFGVKRRWQDLFPTTDLWGKENLF